MAGVRSGIRGVVFCFKDGTDFEDVKLSLERRLQDTQVRGCNSQHKIPDEARGNGI